MQWLLAPLSLGAGAIHLAMVPQHAQESLMVGLAFAVAGWFHIAYGMAMLARPTAHGPRPTARWLQLAIAANLAFLATWTLSRTVGLPTWTGHGGIEDASSTDVVCVLFEAGIVIDAIALLARPNLLERWKRPAITAATILPAGILVATTCSTDAPTTTTTASCSSCPTA